MTRFVSLRGAGRAAFLAAWCAAAATGTHAQAVLFKGPAGQVSAMDVQADAATRISDAARPTLLSHPATVEQLASNVYVQRAMAAQAQAKGLAANPAAEAQLALGREKALADLYWADFDKTHQPTEAALEAYAQSTYRTADDKALQAPERTHVRHILLKAATPNARTRVSELLAKLKAGADFAPLARENSEDQGSAAHGGDLGFVAEGEMDPAFRRAVAALKNPGDLSDVIETPYGYHIVRLEERRAAGKRPFDEVREPLLMQARAALLKEARANDVQNLLKGAQANEEAIGAFSSQFKPVEAR